MAIRRPGRRAGVGGLLGRPLHGEGRQGRAAHGVLDRVEPEQGDESGSAELLHAAAERSDLVDERVDHPPGIEGAGVAVRRQPRQQDREAPPLPPDRDGAR